MIKNHTYIQLCRARDLLRAEYANQIAINVAAKEAGMSLYHFIRTFKSAFGQTPHNFLTQVRLDMAKHLLATGNISVTELCLDVGFSSLGSFSYLFSRHVGMPPSTYQRTLRSLVQVPGYYPYAMIPHCFAMKYFGQK